MVKKKRPRPLLLGCIAFLALALIFTGGCFDSNDPTNLIKAVPEVKNFLDEHPGASIKVIYLDLAYVNENIEHIRSVCGGQMGIAPYYYGTVTDEDRTIEVYTDGDAKKVLCMITPGSAGGNQGGSGSIEGVQDKSDEESEFQEIVCGQLPLSATHLANDVVAVFIPGALPYRLQEMGAQMTLKNTGAAFETEQQYYDPDTNSGAYYWNCWVNGGANTHICIIPISATFLDGSGNMEAKTGAIRLKFEGPLEALESVTAEAQATTSADKTSGNGPAPQPSYPVSDTSTTATSDPLLVSSYLDSSCPQPSGGGEGGPRIVSGATGRYWLPKYEEMEPNCNAGLKKATPTFTRTDCMIDFENPCPGMEGFESCGRCPYELTTYVLAQERENVQNLGQCRYCGNGQVCAATNDYALCRDMCVTPSVPVANNNGGEKTYYVNCGQCAFSDPITYWGPDYGECNDLYYDCVDAGCGKIYDNCR